MSKNSQDTEIKLQVSLAPERDAQKLRRSDLLDDYLFRSNNRNGALVATALRTRSVSMRDILVHQAILPAMDSSELRERLLAKTVTQAEISDYFALAELGRLVILQNIFPDDLEYGEVLIQTALESDIRSKLPKYIPRVLVQHYICSGQRKAAAMTLDEFASFSDEDHGYMRAELANPFSLGSRGTYIEWLRSFNRAFKENGLSQICLDDRTHLAPFDRLMSSSPQEHSRLTHSDQELVSIVLTAYRPSWNSLHSSVRSILDQTWQNLELIIVDDCSGPEFDLLFSELEMLDKRIQVIRAPENRGTYVARNIGYAAAEGTFITGQDDDDWSHPQRIAQQVQYMNEHPEAIGCRVLAVRADENLNRVRVGYRPISENASSLLVRREGFRETGGFLEARKAADTEFFYRVSKVTGRPVGLISKPLSIIRIMGGSLSRSEFAPGWRHTARRSFRSSYEYWHANSKQDELRLTPALRAPVKVPRRFQVKQDSNELKFDVVLAGDWQQYGGPQKSMIEEIHALTRANYRVGIMNLEAARFMTKSDRKRLNPVIQKMINEGYVDEVHYDESAYIRLLILRYPPILQFFTHTPSSLDVESMIILANQAPSELDGRDIRYLVEDCDHNARVAFDTEPIWVPQGPQVREFLEHYLSYPKLANFDMPGILDLGEWWHDRLWYRSDIPVVGRHSRDNIMKWPEDSDILSAVYPGDGTFDVRIMGGARSPLKVMKIDSTPPGWTVYRTDELPVAEFLHSLDYFIFFQHSEAVEAFGRAILEALASGTLVILPAHFAKVFGEAAIYCDASEVPTVVGDYHSDFSRYRRQLDNARSVLEDRFSYGSYVKRIESILLRQKA